MSNRLFVFLLAVCAVTSTYAEVRWGQVELAFFRIRGEDGRMVDLPTAGVVLPVRMERVQGRSIFTPRAPVPYFDAPVFTDATLVYMNDLGTNYFFNPDGSSALDDINILPAGNGQDWYDLTIGCD